jgi:hypothetical protein
LFGAGPWSDPRNEASLLLQRIGQILLTEHHIGVEVGEGCCQQEVEEPVEKVSWAEEAIDGIGDRSESSRCGQ